MCELIMLSILYIYPSIELDHVHGPKIQHGDHFDFLVPSSDREEVFLHHCHSGHCDEHGNLEILQFHQFNHNSNNNNHNHNSTSHSNNINNSTSDSSENTDDDDSSIANRSTRELLDDLFNMCCFDTNCGPSSNIVVGNDPSNR